MMYSVNVLMFLDKLIELYTPELDIPRPLRELAGIIKLNTDKQ